MAIGWIRPLARRVVQQLGHSLRLVDHQHVPDQTGGVRLGQRFGAGGAALGYIGGQQHQPAGPVSIGELGLDERGLALDEAARADLNRAWHRLDPWPDVPAGLARLKAMCPVATLSNGNLRLLLDLARHGGLAWDALFSAELFGHYKPDPETYLGAARLLDVAPARLTLVAAHPDDLRAAARCGLGTALVLRPDEIGVGRGLPAYQDGEFDVVVDGFGALADQWRA